MLIKASGPSVQVVGRKAQNMRRAHTPDTWDSIPGLPISNSPQPHHASGFASDPCQPTALGNQDLLSSASVLKNPLVKRETILTL